MIDSPHLMDLAAFVAVEVGVIILILVGHASAELLTAASAVSTGIYSLWARHPHPRPGLDRPQRSAAAAA